MRTGVRVTAVERELVNAEMVFRGMEESPFLGVPTKSGHGGMRKLAGGLASR